MKENIVAFPERGRVAEEAATWLIRLDGDTPPSREELAELREWVAASPAHAEALRELAGQWQRMNVLTELAVPLGKLHPTAPARAARSHNGPWRGLKLAAMAATVAVAAAIGAFLVLRSDPLLASNGLYATAVGQQRDQRLADDSEVQLNTNSQIRVDFDEQYRNVVLLQGEVHFTVAKMRERPFRVYAGGERIEAVGTAFSVRLKDDAVDVAVTDGRVSLARVETVMREAPSFRSGTAENAGSVAKVEPPAVDELATLSAGQVAIIRRGVEEPAAGSNEIAEVQTVPADILDRRLSWREGMLSFSGESLAEVVAEISRYTTVEIEIADPAMAELRIGGRFPVGETEVMLEALADNFGLSVRRVNANRVVLSVSDK